MDFIQDFREFIINRLTVMGLSHDDESTLMLTSRYIKEVKCFFPLDRACEVQLSNVLLDKFDSLPQSDKNIIQDIKKHLESGTDILELFKGLIMDEPNPLFKHGIKKVRVGQKKLYFADKDSYVFLIDLAQNLTEEEVLESIKGTWPNLLGVIKTDIEESELDYISTLEADDLIFNIAETEKFVSGNEYIIKNQIENALKHPLPAPPDFKLEFSGGHFTVYEIGSGALVKLS
ncbi:MAG: hypothetical protein Q8865_10535 [Bacillota bacterium]|nr:hypothetical protein [Bacillota bacterium]